MTLNERNEIISNFIDENCKGILASKGEDYAGKDADPNRNFSVVAEWLGLTKYQVWAVYFSKHVLAVLNSIKANPEKPERKAESIDGSIADGINYLGILESMLSENREKVGEAKNIFTLGDTGCIGLSDEAQLVTKRELDLLISEVKNADSDNNTLLSEPAQIPVGHS